MKIIKKNLCVPLPDLFIVYANKLHTGTCSYAVAGDNKKMTKRSTEPNTD